MPSLNCANNYDRSSIPVNEFKGPLVSFVEVKDAHVTDTPTLPFDPMSVRGACAIIDYARKEGVSGRRSIARHCLVNQPPSTTLIRD